MSNPVEPHFSKVWYAVVFGFMGVLALPLEWAGVWWWTTFEHTLGFAALVLFAGVEFVAGALHGWEGTMTAWTMAKIHQRWLRLLWSFVIVFLMWWRLPWFAYFNWIVAGAFLTWLPIHYWGAVGPIDRLARAVGKLIGVGIRID